MRPPGCDLKLTHPAHFRNNDISTDAFTVIRFHKRTPIFVAIDHPHLVCRLRKATLAEAVITRS
jgi:hypothetical protein